MFKKKLVDILIDYPVDRNVVIDDFGNSDRRELPNKSERLFFNRDVQADILVKIGRLSMLVGCPATIRIPVPDRSTCLGTLRFKAGDADRALKRINALFHIYGVKAIYSLAELIPAFVPVFHTRAATKRFVKYLLNRTNDVFLSGRLLWGRGNIYERI